MYSFLLISYIYPSLVNASRLYRQTLPAVVDEGSSTQNYILFVLLLTPEMSSGQPSDFTVSIFKTTDSNPTWSSSTKYWYALIGLRNDIDSMDALKTLDRYER